MKSPFVRFIILTMIVVVPGVVHAQSFELIPTAGYVFGGDAYDYWSGASVSLDNGSSYGLAVDIPIGHMGESFLEIYWSRHSSGATTFGFEPTYLDLDIDVFQAGGVYEFPGVSHTVRPYVAGTVGFSVFKASKPWSGSETVFSAGLGGGVKLMFSDHVGFRLDGRGLFNFVGGSGSSLGCGPGGCWLGFSSDVLFQFEATAGLVIGF